jgi:hypothetical protein
MNQQDKFQVFEIVYLRTTLLKEVINIQDNQLNRYKIIFQEKLKVNKSAGNTKRKIIYKPTNI